MIMGCFAAQRALVPVLEISQSPRLGKKTLLTSAWLECTAHLRLVPRHFVGTACELTILEFRPCSALMKLKRAYRLMGAVRRITPIAGI